MTNQQENPQACLFRWNSTDNICTWKLKTKTWMLALMHVPFFLLNVWFCMTNPYEIFSAVSDKSLIRHYETVTESMCCKWHSSQSYDQLVIQWVLYNIQSILTICCVSYPVILNFTRAPFSRFACSLLPHLWTSHFCYKFHPPPHPPRVRHIHWSAAGLVCVFF